MLRNYLTIAFRNLWRNRLYSFINIGGLATGIAVSLLILLYVVHEHSYDRFHKNANRTVQLFTSLETGGMTINTNSLPFSVTDRVARQTPQVEAMTRLISGDWQGKDVIQYGNKPLYIKNVRYAEPSFFDLFNFPMKREMVAKPWPAPNNYYDGVAGPQPVWQRRPAGENGNAKSYLRAGNSRHHAGLTFKHIFSFSLLISASTFNLIADEWQRKYGPSGETFLRLTAPMPYLG